MEDDGGWTIDTQKKKPFKVNLFLSPGQNEITNDAKWTRSSIYEDLVV